MEVARRLGGVAPEVAVRELAPDTTALIAAWQGWAHVILIGAAHAGVSAGTVRRFEAHRRPLPAALYWRSSHGRGVDHAIELARALGLLPETLVVYAVQGEERDGPGLSPAVAAAVD